MAVTTRTGWRRGRCGGGGGSGASRTSVRGVVVVMRRLRPPVPYGCLPVLYVPADAPPPALALAGPLPWPGRRRGPCPGRAVAGGRALALAGPSPGAGPLPWSVPAWQGGPLRGAEVPYPPFHRSQGLRP
ncbi:hypothetical protein GCM10017750_52400 [Streptomyces racemochromogenes]